MSSTFQQNIKSWVEVDNQIKKMSDTVKELRERITPKNVIVKKYTFEGKEVVIAKEETTYSITVDGNLLSDDFDNQVEAEEAATSFLELLIGEEEEK